MKLSDYLKEIQHAVELIISEIYREYELIEILEAELIPLMSATKDGYNRSNFLAMNPDLDDEGLGTMILYDTYFGADKERHYKTIELERAKQKLAAHRFSISALAGSLLQYAKQGITLRYGKHRDDCPDARLVAGMTLHEVIWQGRNQAIHWDEGSFNKRKDGKDVDSCFQQLASSIDSKFSDYCNGNMAFEVISLLGWKTFDDFASDMILLD
jgi:hypothetical protein